MKSEPTRKSGLSYAGRGLIGLVVVVLATVVVLNVTARVRLRSRLASLRAAGEPTSIAELAPKPVPDAENAAAQLRTARPLLDAFSADYASFLETPLGMDYQARREMGLPPTDEQIARMDAILKAHGGLLAKVRQATQCETYASLLDFSVDHSDFVAQMVDSTPLVRTAARLMAWQIEVSVAHGDIDAAVTTGTDVLRLARLDDNEPSLFSFLLANACRQVAISELNYALRQGPVSDDVRARLRDELARYDGPAQLARALEEERAVNLDGISQNSGSALAQSIGWWTKDWQITLIDFYEIPLAVAALPWYQGNSKLAALATKRSPAVVAMMLPSIQSAYESSNRAVARIRCLNILNELGRYRQEHGEEASGLADLGLPRDLTLDPFTGKPIVVEHTDAGWQIGPTPAKDTSTTTQPDWGLSP